VSAGRIARTLEAAACSHFIYLDHARPPPAGPCAAWHPGPGPPAGHGGRPRA